MNKPSPRVLAIFSVVAGVIVLTTLAACTANAVYLKRSDSGFTRAVGSWLPAARVQGTTIRYGEVLRTRDTLKVYLKSEAAQAQGFGQDLTPELEKKATVERLMRDIVVEGLAKEKNVSVADQEVQDEFTKMTATASTTVTDVNEFLTKNFGWTQAEFQKNVVRPSLLETRLVLTFGSSTQEQVQAYQAEVEARLKAGKVYLKY